MAAKRKKVNLPPLAARVRLANLEAKLADLVREQKAFRKGTANDLRPLVDKLSLLDHLKSATDEALLEIERIWRTVRVSQNRLETLEGCVDPFGRDKPKDEPEDVLETRLKSIEAKLDYMGTATHGKPYRNKFGRK